MRRVITERVRLAAITDARAGGRPIEAR